MAGSPNEKGAKESGKFNGDLLHHPLFEYAHDSSPVISLTCAEWGEDALKDAHQKLIEQLKDAHALAVFAIKCPALTKMLATHPPHTGKFGTLLADFLGSDEYLQPARTISPRR